MVKLRKNIFLHIFFKCNKKKQKNFKYCDFLKFLSNIDIKKFKNIFVFHAIIIFFK